MGQALLRVSMGDADRGIGMIRVTVPALVGFATVLGMLAPRLGDEGDLHRRLQEARLGAELSCGRPALLASEPPALDSPEQFDWVSLLETAATGAPHERWQAIEILGEFGNASAVPSLLKALVDRKGTVRPCLAAQSLGRLGDPRAIDALIDAAAQSGNDDLRLCAIKSLGLLRTERAVPVLAEAVRRRDMVVTAAYALARIGTQKGAQVVAEAARDRELAPWLVGPLGEFGAEAVEPELQRLVRSENSGAGTRHAAREALWKLDVLRTPDRENALVLVLDSESSSERRAWAAWRLGDEGFAGSAERLATALGDPSDRVAMASAAALLRFGAASEKSLLDRASDPGPAGRLAVAALGLVGTERSFGFLSSIGKKHEIGQIAGRSLQWIRHRGFRQPTTLARRRAL